ncbi:MAG: proliferating cell nuclear antigen (pcna) [Nanoarchaeota archaeon]|nr:proliferating cell nuclear antigen (pcna) [Nanoarchaeota archaeon]MBU1004684.1 proliferating cell nuclear antigen (pcna) [Nanoarchaeota archaeon]MBU1945809.1 proliferating cell nuclear antigen (pcna) [Nanoarchaeota archaeon]
MKLTLAEPTYLKDSINIISELVNEARFKVSKDAMELVAMDPANVAMVIFKLLSSCFTEYDVKEETQIAINLGNLKQILRRVSSNDMLSLELTKDNKLSIQLRGNTTRTFNLPIIELEEKEQKIPDLKFPIAVTMPSSTLTGAIEDADIVAESVTLEVEQGKFNIHASGDLSQAKIEISASDSIKIEANEKVKSKYSIEYLKKMIGGSKLSENVEIRFNNDYPLRLDFKTIDKISLSFILAPRVENE